LKYFIPLIAVFILFLSCHSQSTQQNLAIQEVNLKESIDTLSQINSRGVDTLRKGIDLSIKNPGLVDVQLIDSSILVELRYATTNNFMGAIMYDSIDRLFLQKEVAIKLKKAHDILQQLHPHYRLLVYDGVRPLSVQQKMWDALDSIPVAERGKFLSNPKNGSIHNYGAAVDLTICDESGIPLDMGADYDEIRKIAYPSMEQFFLQKGELTQQHINNRKLLRSVMSQAGFYNIQTEWWHFNSCSRAVAKKQYTLIR